MHPVSIWKSRRNQPSVLLTDSDRAGRALYVRCKDFKHADSEVNDLVLLTQALWSKIERQLLVLRKTASSLADNYQELQNQMLDRLHSKIEELMTKVDKFQTITSFRRCV